MGAGMSEWQRVDNAGCVSWVWRAFLLSWAVIVPYALIFRNFGWLVWSLGCVILGAVLVTRAKRQMRVREIPGTVVEVVPEEARPGEWIVVRLKVGEELQSTIRWWKASLVAGDGDEAVLREVEFAVDQGAPVTELDMTIETPSQVESQAWFVRVTVEAASGKMVSGKVRVRVAR